MFRKIIVVGCVAFSLVGSGKYSESIDSPTPCTDLIPRSVLLAHPDRFCVSMNHAGDKIAYLARKGSGIELRVEDLSGNLLRKFDVKPSRRLYNFVWAYTGKHILIEQDKDGDENDHVIGLDIETGSTRDLTPFAGAKSGVYQISKKYPQEIIVFSNKNNPKWFDAYRVNILTGKIDLVFESAEKYTNFIFDHDFNIRIAGETLPNGDVAYYLIENGKFLPFKKVPFEDTKSTNFLSFNADNKIIYAAETFGRDKQSLFAYELDILTPEIERFQNKAKPRGRKFAKILFTSTVADVNEIIADPNTLAPQCVVVDYLRPEFFVLDKAIAKDIKYLKSQSGGKDVDIVTRNESDNVWLVSLHDSDSSRRWYLYQRDAEKRKPISLKFLFSSKPQLDKYKLQKKTPVVIKSRDGLNLVCYLTKSFDFQKGIPGKLIVYVHGGPWCRDGNYYESTVQLLANRGYSVLQINYRASSGFGKKFLNAGDGNIEKIRNDIIDGVNWAINHKIAAKNKVGIMGASFGGYSTLAGLAFSPDLFCCGVAVVGPSNLVTFMETIPSYWLSEIEIVYRMFGDLRTEKGRDYARKNSPLTYVKNFQKPLIIFHGKNDPRVNKNESDQIVAALKEKGLPVAYVLYPDEGHGFHREPNEKSYLAITEIFLAKIMGGRCEPINSEELNGSSHQILEGQDLIGL
ncbi:MAG: S9 family peptidase [Holosporaceae bacterium]|jgi:dipeptidyl aminopeptidase/acylaminoacyl peptidase|nr:S9 family peptidase [Holosporaceae bacterium]